LELNFDQHYLLRAPFFIVRFSGVKKVLAIDKLLLCHPHTRYVNTEMAKEIKIGFVYWRNLAPFMKKDLNMLQRHFTVVPLRYSGKRDIPSLVGGVMSVDLIFSWFADDHSAIAVFAAKLFKKKTIVVVGGVDAACVPEINFGNFLHPLRKHYTKFVVKFADKILTVDESLKIDLMRNTGLRCENVETVHTSYNSDYWKPEGKKDDKLVITVSTVSQVAVKRKGLDTFVLAAHQLPDIKFVLIGKWLDNSINYLKRIAPPNVEFTGYVSDRTLKKYYQKAKVYAQLSRYEGLPNALCEAMLCECIPVATEVCGIPTAVGTAGFYVPYGDPDATASVIRSALKSEIGSRARERIKQKFPIEKREYEILRIISSIQ
jgi:glycosyltransferase involved in cell wall biosynthesis